MREYVTTEYECTECGERDSDRSEIGNAPLALICHRCRAGHDLTPQQQVAHMKGMVRVTDLEVARSAGFKKRA